MQRNKVTGKNEEKVTKKDGVADRKKANRKSGGKQTNKQTRPSFPVRCESWQVSLNQEKKLKREGKPKESRPDATIS